MRSDDQNKPVVEQKRNARPRPLLERGAIGGDGLDEMLGTGLALVSAGLLGDAERDGRAELLAGLDSARLTVLRRRPYP